MGDSKFQCSLARFVISNQGWIAMLANCKSKWSLKSNMMYSGGNEKGHQEMRTNKNGESRVDKGSIEGVAEV